MRTRARNKLTEHDETLVHALYGEGLVVAEIASKFEVSQETIRRALKRKTWSQAKQNFDGASRIAIEALEKIMEVPYGDMYSAKEIAWVAIKKIKGRHA
jgi:transposase